MISQEYINLTHGDFHSFERQNARSAICSRKFLSWIGSAADLFV